MIAALIHATLLHLCAAVPPADTGARAVLTENGPRSNAGLGARPGRNACWTAIRRSRATTEAALAKGAQRSLPVLRRLLSRQDEDLQAATFEVIRRIGPPAIPMLVDLLRDKGRLPSGATQVDTLH